MPGRRQPCGIMSTTSAWRQTTGTEEMGGESRGLGLPKAPPFRDHLELLLMQMMVNSHLGETTCSCDNCPKLIA